MLKFRDNLYLGNMLDADGVVHTNNLGNPPIFPITAVLNVAYDVDLSPRNPNQLRYVKVALMDNLDNPAYLKRAAVDTLKAMLQAGETVLVHCAAGMSRSVYVMLMAVSELEGVDPHDLYEELHQIYPSAMYGPLFMSTYIPIGAEDGS